MRNGAGGETMQKEEKVHTSSDEKMSGNWQKGLQNWRLHRVKTY